MRIVLIGLLISMCAAAAQAQYPWPDERPECRQQAVLNEDGGRSYIVRPASGSLVGLVKPGASATVDLQQYSIFLGPGWSDPALRGSEERLSKLLTNVRDHALNRVLDGRVSIVPSAEVRADAAAMAVVEQAVA